MTPREDLPVVVIGAGPVGLAAAAHLVSRGMKPLVLEAGDDVASNIRSWGHVRLFSPWRYDIDRAARALLQAEGWTAPDDERLPTGDELVEQYLRPLARVPVIASGLRLRTRVVAVTRRDFDLVETDKRGEKPFVVRALEDGGEKDFEARAVIDASGTWASPNPLGASGLHAHGERAARDLVVYGIPDVLGADRATYAGRTTLVVGAGHSAANAILTLAELSKEAPNTRIVWATRGADMKRAFGGGDADGLPARGQLETDLRQLVDDGALTLVTGFRIQILRPAGKALAVVGTRGDAICTIEGVERIIAATGQRPDLSIFRELRVSLDPALECATALRPRIDPNERSRETVRPHGAVELAHPEPDFYVIGNKSYGRAPTFLLATGYEQARSVVAMLAGDREAALRVELEMPEAGVCGVGPCGRGTCCAPANGDARQKASRVSCCA
jgi:hypothetical protein